MQFKIYSQLIQSYFCSEILIPYPNTKREGWKENKIRYIWRVLYQSRRHGEKLNSEKKREKGEKKSFVILYLMIP